MHLPTFEPTFDYEPSEPVYRCARCGYRIYDDAPFCQLCDFVLNSRSDVDRHVWRLMSERGVHHVSRSGARLRCMCSEAGEKGQCSAIRLLRALRCLPWQWEGKNRVVTVGDYVFRAEPPLMDEEPCYRLFIRFKHEASGYSDEHKLPIWFWK